MKKRFNKKGSSLITVLGAMLILTAVGVLVITMASANMRMSGKYKTWTEEYYDLDYAAQERLVEFDRDTLVKAERMARYYLQNNYFAYESVKDFPEGGEEAGWLAESLADGALQFIFHARQLAATELLKAKPNEDSEKPYDPQAAYDAEMELLARETFETLYYYRVDQLLKKASAAPQDATGRPGLMTRCELVTVNWFPETYGGLNDLLEQVENKLPQIAITAYEPEALYEPETQAMAKQVRVLVTLKSPSYELTPQMRYVPLKINPLYTNALSATGTIKFMGGSSVEITGDVLSNNGGIKTIEENNKGGILAYSASVTVHGNVYSAGDIHVAGDGGSISILEYPGGYTNSLKEKLYKNDYYLEQSVYDSVARFAEGQTASGIIPYLYRDSGGGNAYCNSLAAEAEATGGTLSVAGDLWTMDDIQVDASGAHIYVGGNYIGISSDAKNGDPNGSSAVINNAVLSGGLIEIGGDYVIPGTAFYIFKDNDYYQTAESGSARTIESFAAYLALEGEQSATYYGQGAGEVYELYDADELEDQINHFRNYFTLSKIIPESGITVKSGGDYYTLGVVVDQDGSIHYDGGSNRYVNNQVEYSHASVLMPNVLEAKTRYYSTDGRGIGGVNSLINPSFAVSDRHRGFYYFDGAEVAITVGKGANAISSGIIYCDADELTINGNGEFRGAIICRGDVVVTGNAKLTYDEDAVLKVLGATKGSTVIPAASGSRIARRFFSPEVPLTMGDDLGTEQIDTVSVSAGERVVSDAVDRYTINAWRESHVPQSSPQP